jgi:hypothetical protein
MAAPQRSRHIAQHDRTEFIPGCFRCDLSRESLQYPPDDVVEELARVLLGGSSDQSLGEWGGLGREWYMEQAAVVLTSEWLENVLCYVRSEAAETAANTRGPDGAYGGFMTQGEWADWSNRTRRPGLGLHHGT